MASSVSNDYSTLSREDFQLDSSELTDEELKLNLDIFENSPQAKAFIDSVVESRRFTRHGFPARAMLRGIHLRYVMNLKTMKALVQTLRLSPYLRLLCGFADKVPSESTFSRFVKRIAAAEELVMDSLPTLVNALHNTNLIPGVGSETAIDGSDIEAHGNGKKPLEERSDKTAEHGVRTVKRGSANTEKVEEYFGYELTLLVDTAYGVPLAWELMPANADEKKMLPPVLERALAHYDWLEVGHLSADRGYDSRSVYLYLWEEQNVVPIIPMRRPPKRKGKKRSLYDGIYDYRGRPTCDGQVAMRYVATDPVSGKHLYVCPESGCKFKDRSSGAMRYCIPTELHFEDPADNPKTIGVLARSSPEFKERYNRRQTVERTFSSAKESRLLGEHRYLDFMKIYAHVSLSLTSYVVTMLARVLMGQIERIRQMGVEMPTVPTQFLALAA